MRVNINTPTVSAVKANKNIPYERIVTNDVDLKSIDFSDSNIKFVFYPIILADVDQACARFHVGRNTMRRLAEEAGAVVRIDRLFKIHIPTMDAYFERIIENNRR